MRSVRMLLALALFDLAVGASLRSAGSLAATHGSKRAAGGAAGGSQANTREEAMALAKSSLGEVIQLLAQMLHEFDTQAEEDRHNWDAYSKWSADAEDEKNNFIVEQKALIMQNKATLSANREEVQTLTADLAQLATEIAEETQSLKELNEMRHEEHQQFQASLADVTKTINAVAKATGILQGHYGASGAAALAQIRSRVQMALTMFGRHTPSATEKNVKMLSSMLQVNNNNPDFLNADTSKYENYEKQGGSRGVIGMLEDLSTQLEAQRNDLIATESAAQREYEATKLTKETNLANMKHVQSEKTARKAECEATIEQCIATIDQAEKEIVEAEAYLKQLLLDRAQFQKVFGERTAMRTQERGATQAALDALQSVSAGAKDNVGFVQRSPMFLQTSSRSARINSRVGKALNKLVDLGLTMHEPALLQTATATRQDYFETQQQQHFDEGKFGPVLKLLTDLITKLEEEHAAETSQHEWCNTEKETSVANKEGREKTIKKLMATIESLTTSIATLKSEVEFLESEIKRVEEETRIAKEIRAQEHEVYLQAKKDHEEVIGAINLALEALGGQYGLLQFGQQPGGPMPFSEYGSGKEGAASAQEMLQDLHQRYTEALVTIISEEEAAQKSHEELLIRNAQFIEDCTHSKNAKTSERRGLINRLSDDKAEMKTTLIELHEVGQYLMDLRPSCDDIRSTFEERTKRREAEISALKEALAVITDPTAAA